MVSTASTSVVRTLAVRRREQHAEARVRRRPRRDLRHGAQRLAARDEKIAREQDLDVAAARSCGGSARGSSRIRRRWSRAARRAAARGFFCARGRRRAVRGCAAARLDDRLVAEPVAPRAASAERGAPSARPSIPITSPTRIRPAGPVPWMPVMSRSYCRTSRRTAGLRVPAGSVAACPRAVCRYPVLPGPARPRAACPQPAHPRGRASACASAGGASASARPAVAVDSNAVRRVRGRRKHHSSPASLGFRREHAAGGRPARASPPSARARAGAAASDIAAGAGSVEWLGFDSIARVAEKNADGKDRETVAGFQPLLECAA